MSSDPTRIDIEVDPTVQRMRGIAVHGNTPFDVPYISEIVPGFWQGGCENGLVLPENIKHVISLYKWEKYTVNHELDSSMTVTMYDSQTAPMNEDQLISVATWVNVCRDSGKDVLVHCQAGLNRSGLIAAIALGLDGYQPDEAINLLRTNRSPAVLCNKTFESWLRENCQHEE